MALITKLFIRGRQENWKSQGIREIVGVSRTEIEFRERDMKMLLLTLRREERTKKGTLRY